MEQQQQRHFTFETAFKHLLNINKLHFLRVYEHKMSDCVEIQPNKASFSVEMTFWNDFRSASQLLLSLLGQTLAEWIGYIGCYHDFSCVSTISQVDIISIFWYAYDESCWIMYTIQSSNSSGHQPTVLSPHGFRCLRFWISQNKTNERYSRLFQSFLSVISIHIIRIMTNLKCLCGEHLRDNSCCHRTLDRLLSADSEVKELSIV